MRGDGEDEGFVPKLERMWREQDYIEPRAKLGYFPCNADGNELVIFDPESPDNEIERLQVSREVVRRLAGRYEAAEADLKHCLELGDKIGTTFHRGAFQAFRQVG